MKDIWHDEHGRSKNAIFTCCMSSKITTSDPEATKAALEPPKQERMMNRGCLFGSIRYSIAGSLTARRASSAETQPGVSSAQRM